MERPRWLLTIEVIILRLLANIGFFLASFVSPRPPSPSFKRRIPTTVSPFPGRITIQFYVPKDWQARRDSGQQKFPIVINYHGGGFTIGGPTDDARWAASVLNEVGAIVASVDYRMAPEYPFPTAVEDGTDAVLYIFNHADELHVDVDKIAVSGFSAGGNLTLTVPLMLNELLRPGSRDSNKQSSIKPTKNASTSSRSLSPSAQGPKIAAIVAWYPPTDYSLTRPQRVATLARTDKQLHPALYAMFNESYIYPRNMDVTSPFISPLLAPEDMLEGLPHEIILYTCEWDILQAEGQRMSERLKELGKNVKYRRIEAARHGWDKFPTREIPPSVPENYSLACKELRRIFKAK